MSSLLIDSVASGSIAAQLEIASGDRLLAVNGHPLRDLIDYSYFVASEEDLLLLVEKQDGDIWELEVERYPGETLGLSFATPTPARCANNCLFCFVNQLPRGLRKSLYVKDEDYRLSFLNGNYVTLANLKASELKRITEQRLSPLYISVHATNPDLRAHLLGKTVIPPIIDQLRKLSAARIIMHAQIVICPGLNDGDELRRSLEELAALFPSVQSVAIVPLGLTSHRSNLPKLTAIDRGYAEEFISTWQPYAEKLRKKLGRQFVYIADEFYLKGGIPFPPVRSYGNFPQLENGVGLVSLFLRDASRLLRRVRPVVLSRVTVVTGVSSFGFVRDFLAELSYRCGAEIVPLAVRNSIFGPSVTVSGLVCGNDILSATKGRNLGSCLFVPDVMVKEGENIFLDDISLEVLERLSGCPVVLFDSTPSGFYRVLRSVGRKTG